ncbi:MAG: hypothetical protein V2J25_09900 [Desulfatiglans sp.]|jgi:hypothetical protein|nr:hypothetical protein [Thermodesulfobacteriota bacterium]MEE4353171.1 hypothetical protein [Desulfatiglans sp.]
MKRYFFLFQLILLIVPSYSSAEDFLGAPVISQGVVLDKTDTRLELKVPLSHDQALGFYRDVLNGQPDVKFRDWKNSTYIEDNGRRSWHSITISKGGGGESTVVIMKDNWTWIIGTLVLRYIGVFAVLIVLFLGMALSGSIISRFAGRTSKASG